MPVSKFAAVKFRATVTIQPAKFEVSPSVRYLDIAKLSKAASAEIEIGHYQVDRVRRAVYAVISDGVVREVKVEGCSDCQPPSPELARALKTAERQFGPRRKWTPVPAAKFFAEDIIVVQGEGPSRNCFAVIWDNGVVTICCGSGDGRYQCVSIATSNVR